MALSEGRLAQVLRSKGRLSGRKPRGFASEEKKLRRSVHAHLFPWSSDTKLPQCILLRVFFFCRTTRQLQAVNTNLPSRSVQLLSGVSFGLPVGTCSRVPRGGKRAGDITTLRSQNEQEVAYFPPNLGFIRTSSTRRNPTPHRVLN